MNFMNLEKMITKQEFKDKLKNYKYIEDITEDTEYKFPVVEYYLKNHSNLQLIISNKVMSLKDITLLRMNKEDERYEHQLISYAFQEIQEELGYKK